MFLLFADHDSDAAEMLAELLRLCIAAPLEIVLVCAGKEAPAAAAELALPDVVVMDIETPRMNGIHAAVAIRRAPGSLTPLSSRSADVDRAQLASVGGVLHHEPRKPVTVDQLLRPLKALRSKEPRKPPAREHSS